MGEMMGEMMGVIWERFGRDERHLSYSLPLCIKAFSKIMGEMRPKSVITYQINPCVLILPSRHSIIRGTFIRVYS
jgi:hypothetical protein